MSALETIADQLDSEHYTWQNIREQVLASRGLLAKRITRQ
jgi:hypothetical protein